MKRALVILKPTPHYRRDAFETGLKKIGFTIVSRLDEPKAGDVAVVWNLTGLDRMAARFKAAGAHVIVAENAYITPNGVAQMYAVSEGGHNGAGRYPAQDDASRWRALGMELKPWRTTGTHILVCGQRGIGSREMASPHAWHQKIAEKLQRVTKRPIKVRAHPGNKTQASGPPLSHDLKDAWAVVVWASSSGVKALVDGIPVYYAAPHWICSGAALPLSKAGDLESPLMSHIERDRALHRMAWGQWSHEEIATGAPLKGVIEC